MSEQVSSNVFHFELYGPERLALLVHYNKGNKSKYHVKITKKFCKKITKFDGKNAKKNVEQFFHLPVFRITVKTFFKRREKNIRGENQSVDR